MPEFTTTIFHPRSDQRLSVTVTYEMRDLGRMMVKNENVQPVILSVFDEMAVEELGYDLDEEALGMLRRQAVEDHNDRNDEVLIVRREAHLSEAAGN